jgi:regulatory protein YycI of two-component signal transduction system YycFG
MGFIIAKLLAFLPFGNLLKGASGKLIMIVGVILLLVFLVWRYNGAIVERATAMFNQQQLEETVKFQQREITRLHSIEAERNKAIEQAIADNEALLLMVNETKQEARGFTPKTASPVLQHTFKAISKFQNGERVVEEEVEPTGNSAIDAWKKKAKGLLGDSDD